MTVWVIRVDDEGARIFALENNCVIIGSGLGDIRNKTEERINAEAIQVYPGESEKDKNSRSQKIGNVRRFVHSIQVGDIVVLVAAGREDVAIGKIIGCYEHVDDAEARRKHRRSVKWIHRTFPSDCLPDQVHGQLTVHRYGGDSAEMRRIAEAG